VLVIEDNRVNLELMTYLLKAFGHEAHSAESGEEALRRLGDTEFDLVACDIHLPRMDGHQILSAIRERRALRELPVVAVTASAMVGDREQLIAAGFDGYVSKPIDPQTFVSQLEAFLGTRGGQSQGS
jgi:two-component system cell cycle response regulator